MEASICWAAAEAGTQLTVFESPASKKQFLIFHCGRLPNATGEKLFWSALLCPGGGIGVENQIAHDPNIEALCRSYSRGPISLFTGAGVSFTKATHYQTPGWWDLLAEVYHRNHPALDRDAAVSNFDRLRRSCGTAWDVAEALYCQVGYDELALADVIAEALVRRTTRSDRYRRLPRAYLEQAATLNAVIAFCSELSAIRVHPCYATNPRVASVLTLNYDCFLEAGATTKYQNGRVPWPVAAVGMATCVPDAATHQYASIPPGLPVMHVHGYIPYRRHLPPSKFVLTSSSYERAYRTVSRTTEVIRDALSRRPVLFVGLSFSDEYFLQHLEQLHGASSSSRHFALLQRGATDQALLDRLVTRAGVRQILYGEHREIPDILGCVYQAGLAGAETVVPLESKTGQVCGERSISSEEYWKLLLHNKR